jgi:hypothetical protein
MTEQELQIAADRLVQQNVLCCMSGLVSTLASGAGHVSQRTRDYPHEELIEQAVELTAPVEDSYEDAARQAGWTQSPEGWWHREPQEDDGAEHEETHFMFLGSGPFVRANNARDACELDECSIGSIEVYEHWAVSQYLADELTKHGERVDTDFAGLCVWARTTTGQAIGMDSCIRAIVAEVTAP